MKQKHFIMITALMLLSISLFAINDMGKGGSYDGAAMLTSGVLNIGDFVSADPGTGTASGTPADSDPLNVPVEPMDPVDYDGNGVVVVDPDVEANPDENGATISVDVEVIAGNGNVPQPSEVSLSYNISVSGTNQPIRMTLSFVGLPFSPNELIWDNNGTWEEVNGSVWNYGNQTVSFDWTFNNRDGSETFVMNKGDGGTLPVELSSFTAIQTASNFAQIAWKTQSETEILGYNIYRNNNDISALSIKMNNSIIAGHNTSTINSYSYTDETVMIEQDYFYWLESVELDGTNEFFGPIQIRIEKDENDLPENPKETVLGLAYPNPFNPQTTIQFNVKENEKAKLVIFNTRGQIVKDFPSYSTGSHTINWQGKDNDGKLLGSGLYFYRLTSESTNQVRKIILMK